MSNKEMLNKLIKNMKSGNLHEKSLVKDLIDPAKRGRKSTEGEMNMQGLIHSAMDVSQDLYNYAQWAS